MFTEPVIRNFSIVCFLVGVLKFLVTNNIIKYHVMKLSYCQIVFYNI